MENSKKIILDLCGGTGSWSKPYKDAGYDVRVITLPDYDVLKHSFHDPETPMLVFIGSKPGTDIYIDPREVYGILAAPPCTKFSKADWRRSRAERDFREGMRTVRACLEIIWGVQEYGAPLVFWAMENPLGYLYNFMGNPSFFFQPWQFGETGLTATKRTALWGYFKNPARTVFTRTIPFVREYSPKSTAKIEGRVVSDAWRNSSAEDRAKTSAEFAQAFYKANQ